ncbi:MAG: 2-C-methyl-D-erythritol 2,4-cyclodiphosphate synthase [Endomicrobium sp.]|jgi:2-C-methyl-D-erythritol 2,4-cyclodiphosphate synthase|nr:2-C-methyl-D-erythritol 2,4-cyclodiphosphate synthase [Endomicrobium sp.]
MYVGFGYDIHKFKKGKNLILGGVKIKGFTGLAGHSDADVLIHALMDSLLGAAGLNDIGHFFPNTNDKYKNISSISLLQIVYKELINKNFIVNNVDITIIAEIPKIYHFVDKIKRNISKVIKLSEERIGIKATTNEKIGFIGQKKGIIAMVVALINKK